MPYSTTLRGERFTFADLRELLAKANEEKSGDQLAGLAASSERQRVAARDQNIMNLWRAPQVIERCHETAFLRHQLTMPHNARPRAIAAIRRAKVQRQ